MSELGNRPEQPVSSDTPPATIACGGIILASYELAELLASAERQKTNLLKIDNPFDTPAENIAHLSMFAEPSRTENGEHGLSFTGFINLYQPIDHEHVDMIVSEEEDHAYLNSPRSSRSLHAEQIADGQYIRIAHTIGMSAVAEYDRYTNAIVLSNRKSFDDRRGLTGPTALEGPHAVEPRAQLAAFADMYFDLVNYVAHVAQNDPSAATIFQRLDMLPMPATQASKHAELAVVVEPEKPWPMLADIGGLDAIRSKLQMIVNSFEHPELMQKWGAHRPTGVLLHGPPGTGKTMLARAIGNELDAEVRVIQATDIYNKWLGNSEARIKSIFEHAKDTPGRLVIVFDEIGQIIHSRKGGNTSTESVAGIFKQEMNNLNTINPNVLVIGTDNDVSSIDKSLIRAGRFDYVIEVGMPDHNGLIGILANTIDHAAQGSTGKHGFNPFDELNYVETAKLLDGCSGADVAEVVRRALFTKAMTEIETGNASPISQSYFEQVINAYKIERQ